MRKHKIVNIFVSILGLGLILVVLNMATPFASFMDWGMTYELTELTEEKTETESEKKTEEKEFNNAEGVVLKTKSIWHLAQLRNVHFKEEFTASILTPPPERLS